MQPSSPHACQQRRLSRDSRHLRGRQRGWRELVGVHQTAQAARPHGSTSVSGPPLISRSGASVMSSIRRTIHGLIQLVTADHDVALGRTISAACSCDQSIPSTSAASCDAVSRITPSLIGGHCSSRFHNSTRRCHPRPRSVERPCSAPRRDELMPWNWATQAAVRARLEASESQDTREKGVPADRSLGTRFCLGSARLAQPLYKPFILWL